MNVHKILKKTPSNSLKKVTAIALIFIYSFSFSSSLALASNRGFNNDHNSNLGSYNYHDKREEVADSEEQSVDDSPVVENSTWDNNDEHKGEQVESSDDINYYDSGVEDNHSDYNFGHSKKGKHYKDDDHNDNNSGIQCNPEDKENTPPVITLVGNNPINIDVNTNFVDPGATAQDAEDGNITSSIVTAEIVGTTTPGTYTVTYSVTDSDGLSATTTREVKVNPIIVPPSQNKGTVKVCLIVADEQNVISTTSNNLPNGLFTLKLSTSTDFSTSTINTKVWDSTSFIASDAVINPPVKDTNCETFSNLPLGTYYYSELVVNGASWNIPKYNDQSTQSINNIFDFFSYSPELFTATTTDDALRNMNSDGQINLTSGNSDRTLVIFVSYKPTVNQCLLPQIDSPLTISGTVGQSLSHTISATTTSATTTPITFDVATSSLPAGLSFATTTNTISGTPTQAGNFNINLTATNNCGFDTKTLSISIVNPQSGGGGTTTPDADISVTKLADKTTANVGDTLTYTITIVNNGPLIATSVSASDILPVALSFVSATTSLGSYSTTTGMWSIGDLANSSSTTLTLVTTIKDGTTGQTIVNTANASSTVTDSSTSNNTASSSVSVNNPNNPVPPSGGGGSGSGGGGGGGPIYPNNLTIFNESVSETVPGVAMVTWNTNLPATRRVVYDTVSHSVLGSTPNYGYKSSTETVATPLSTLHGMVVSIEAGKTYYFREISTDSTTGVTRTVVGKEVFVTAGGVGGDNSADISNSCYYLYDYLRKDWSNNPVEVKKLQVFLRDLEGFKDLQITGVYDDATILAVNVFQMRYINDVLTPWGHTAPTGYTYILTKKKINEIYCKMAFPVTPLQQIEIDNLRNFLVGLKNAGIKVPDGSYVSPSKNTAVDNSIIGKTATGASTTLATASTTENIMSRLVANVLSASSKVVNWIILALLAFVSYMWYREKQVNDEIDNINKEIDLK